MKLTVKELVLMALYAALFIVLDYTANMLPKMPNGGSVGLGVIPLLMASYHLGWKKGIIVGLSSVLLQFMTGQMWYYHWVQFLLDYIIAFGFYGVACAFPNFKIGHFDLYSGIIITNVVRYLCSVTSGVVFFAVEGASLPETILFSLNYNATYMIPTLIVTVLCVPLIHRRLKPVL